MGAMPPSRARIFDQFYTRPDLAQRLSACMMESLPHAASHYRWLEPSAGGGAFWECLPRGSLALDVEPRHPAVRAADFLAWTPEGEPGPTRRWAVVGNPPFGKNASLAVQFFNHAACFAEAIGFIVPRTFQKPSLQNRLDRRFWLIHEEVLPECSFLFEGEPRAVPCVFQIWVRRTEVRQAATPVRTHPDFSFVPRASADFALQRVGVAAGCVKDLHHRSLAASSHYFLRVTNRAKVLAIRDRFSVLNWDAVKWSTAGNPSISKAEVVTVYDAARTRKKSEVPARLDP